MPAAARVGDSVATGHICATTTTLAAANHNVNIQGANALVVGDLTESHAFPPSPPCAPHVASINAGSSKVTIGGKAAARQTDSCDAGSITSGASMVSIGG